jgi:hypothetical protein
MRYNGETVVRRLHALVARGYRPELGIDDGCCMIHLRHPGKGPAVMLWGDGQLLNAYPTFIKNEADRIIIELEDEDGMKRFLAAVPKPTIFQRMCAATLSDVGYTVSAWLLFIGLCLFIQYLLARIFHA